MKIAGSILADVKEVVLNAIRPGVSIKDLDAIAFSEIIKRNAKPNFLNYYGFSGTICASLNDELIHGVPNQRILQDQDLISIDLGLIYQGYHADMAFTHSIGVNAENDFLINAAEQAFAAGLATIKKGSTIGAIGKAIGNYLKTHNLYTPKEFSGHGIGTKLHERPYVLNYDDPKNLDYYHPIENNMVICIEPMVLQKSAKTIIDQDGWTVRSAAKMKASHYEHTVLIANYQPIILTKGSKNVRKSNEI